MKTALLALLACACTPQEKPVVPTTAVWEPSPGTSWQIQYSGELDPSLDVAMYDVDLFDTSDEDLAALKDAGITVICYFSAGSYEDWREDASEFPDESLGSPLEDWEGEWWLDITSDAVKDVMAARMDTAVSRGCDGVDPDNVNGYTNDTGFGLTASDQLAYNRWLSDEAHGRDLSVGLKNDVDQVEDLLPWFDWTVNEECVDYEECDLVQPFADAGKAVFHLEYVDDWSQATALAIEVCAETPDFDTLIKTWDLGAERMSCTE